MKYRICNAGTRLYVVYPEAITSYEFEVAELLATRIAAMTGACPELVHGGELPEDACAILVGNTGLPETLRCTEELPYGVGILRVMGSRIVLASHTDELLPQLASVLLSGISSSSDGSLELSGAFDGRRVWDGSLLSRLPVCRGGRLVAYRKSHDDCKMLVFGETGRRDFDGYLDCLKESGFAEMWLREIAGNRFACLTDGVALVHVSHTPCNAYLRVIAEPKENAPACVPDNCRRCAPKLFVIGRRFSSTARYMGVDAGAGNMSYVFLLSNGQFLVVDGGLKTEAYTDAILEVLQSNAPDREHITIAAWILTHSHIDHTGAFLQFSEQYANRVELKQVITNFPSIQDAEAFREAWNIRRTKEALHRFWKGTHYAKAHTGDVLTIADAQVEFLYTQEDLVRQYLALPNEEFNNSSLFLRVHIAGQTVLLAGDTEETANGIICAMYGDALKSDLLQVCHHGGRGGTRELYRLIDPEVAFFCTTEALFPKYLSLDYNHALVYEQHLKEVYNASESTYTFSLPYHAAGNHIPPFTGKTYKHARWLEVLAAMAEWEPGG